MSRMTREDRALKYEFPVADALLKLGDRFGQSRPASGLTEMQKWFMILAERQ